MESKFFIWRASYKDGFCVIQPPEGIIKSYQLNRGISRAEGWSPDTVCRMNPEFPKDIQLADNLIGTGLAVVSDQMRELLIKEEINNIEFLPVTILNHKGRVASNDYSIMNPLDVIDCIDLDGSIVKWNLIKKDLISGCKQLVLKEDAVPIECKIFRPKFWPTEILIRTELVEKLFSAGFTGLYFKDPLEYTGIG